MSTIHFNFLNVTNAIDIQLTNGVFELPVQTREQVILLEFYIEAGSMGLVLPYNLGAGGGGVYSFSLDVSVASKGGTVTVTANFEGSVSAGGVHLRSGEPAEIKV